MREIRLSGSEGGGTELNRPSLPLSSFNEDTGFQSGREIPGNGVSEAVSPAEETGGEK